MSDPTIVCLLTQPDLPEEPPPCPDCGDLYCIGAGRNECINCGGWLYSEGTPPVKAAPGRWYCSDECSDEGERYLDKEADR